jgi:hypothetical protein
MTPFSRFAIPSVRIAQSAMKNLKRRLFHAGKMAQKRTTAQGYTSPSRAATFSPFEPRRSRSSSTIRRPGWNRSAAPLRCVTASGNRQAAAAGSGTLVRVDVLVGDFDEQRLEDSVETHP